MPTLMTKDDVMCTAVNLGRAGQVWSAQISKKSGVKIDFMDGKWEIPTWEEEKAMGREIEADFKASLEGPL